MLKSWLDITSQKKKKGKKAQELMQLSGFFSLVWVFSSSYGQACLLEKSWGRCQVFQKRSILF